MRKSLIILSACLFTSTILAAGACRGNACGYTYFSEDVQGCLEIRNAGRKDIQVTVYTAVSGPITVRVLGGHTEKIYTTSRRCLPATDYLRVDSEFDGGVFGPRF
jgi:hypothetical protein